MSTRSRSLGGEAAIEPALSLSAVLGLVEIDGLEKQQIAYKKGFHKRCWDLFRCRRQEGVSALFNYRSVRKRWW